MVAFQCYVNGIVKASCRHESEDDRGCQSLHEVAIKHIEKFLIVN